jgi:hypothetical protein
MDICGSLASQRICQKLGSKKSFNREVTIYEKSNPSKFAGFHMLTR